VAIGRPGIIVYEALWEALPETRSARGCRTVAYRGVHLRTGRTIAIGLPCRSYSCRGPGCGQRVVDGKLTKFMLMARSCPVMWFATADHLRFDSARLSNRLYEKRRHDDDGYVWVERDDGAVWILATLDLGGRLSPTGFIPVTAQQATDAMAAALRLPGVARVQFSNDWPNLAQEEEREEGEPEYEWFGAFSDDAWEETKREAAALAEERFGVPVDPEWPVLFGTSPRLGVRDWIDCLEVVIERRGSH
jgi:hypothetical protein